MQDGCQRILVVGDAVGEEGDPDIDLGTGMPETSFELGSWAYAD